MNCLPSKYSLGIPVLLTLRFHLAENVTGRSSGEPCSLNNEFIFYLFFFCTVHAPAVYGLIIFPCNIALISRVLPLYLLFIIGLNQRLSA